MESGVVPQDHQEHQDHQDHQDQHQEAQHHQELHYHIQHIIIIVKYIYFLNHYMYILEYYVDSSRALRRGSRKGKADVQDYTIIYTFEYTYNETTSLNTDNSSIYLSYDVSHANLSRIIEQNLISNKDTFKLYAYKDSTLYNNSIVLDSQTNTSQTNSSQTKTNSGQGSKIIEYKVAIRNKLGSDHKKRFQEYLINEHKNTITKNTNDMVTNITDDTLIISDVYVEFTTKNELGTAAVLLIVLSALVCCGCFTFAYFAFIKDNNCFDCCKRGQRYQSTPTTATDNPGQTNFTY